MFESTSTYQSLYLNKMAPNNRVSQLLNSQFIFAQDELDILGRILVLEMLRVLYNTKDVTFCGLH